MSDFFVKTVFSDSWSWCGEPSVKIIEDSRDLTKVATTIFGCDYSDMKPDKDHVGIHLVALGDYERYGLNRNFDGFKRASCEKYHPTFKEKGHVFEHHKNKDPAKALGEIVKTAYNKGMGRVELMIHAHREKAAEHLAKYEKDGTVSFSMACKVAFDVCTKCAAHRKNRRDPKACDHLKFEFGKMDKEGGVIGTLNPEPLWFDISFVGRPADRIAWDLKKVAGDDADYLKWSSDIESKLTLPDRIAISDPDASAKLGHMKKIAEFEDMYIGWESGSTHPRTHRDMYLAAVKQAGVSRIKDSDIEELRNFDPETVYRGLASRNIILSPASFFKYAFGTDFGDYAVGMDKTLAACSTVFRSAVKSGSCANICNNDSYTVGNGPGLPSGLLRKIASASAVIGDDMQHRAIFTAGQPGLYKIAVDTEPNILFNSDHSQVLAEEYAAYKLAAVQAVMARVTSNTDTDSAYAVIASQNLVQE